MGFTIDGPRKPAMTYTQELEKALETVNKSRWQFRADLGEFFSDRGGVIVGWPELEIIVEAARKYLSELT